MPRFATLRHDLLAALVAAVALLPTSVAYGLMVIAPLGPDWVAVGMTASIGSTILFGFLAALFGANPHLLSSPRAVTVLMLTAALQVALDRGLTGHEALFLGFSGVMVAGLLQLLAGILRLGEIISYIPYPVLTGFINASSLLLLLQVLPLALGYPELTLGEIVRHPIGIPLLWATLVSGLTFIGTFITLKKFRLLPSALLGLLLGTAIYYLGHILLQLPHAPLAGELPLNKLWQIPLLLRDSELWPLLVSEGDIPLLTGLSIALMVSFDTVITGSALALHRHSDNDSNHDLKLHGCLNALMGLLGFLPASGTLSRSQVILQAGGETHLATVMTAPLLALLLLLFMPLVAQLPLWAMAGLLIATAVRGFDFTAILRLPRLLRSRAQFPASIVGDVLVILLVIAVALLSNLMIAVGVGVVLAILLFVFGMGRRPIRRIFRGSRFHSRVARQPAQAALLQSEGDRIAIIELQGALFFGSCGRVQRKAGELLLLEQIDYLIIDCRHLTSIDTTAAAMLRGLVRLCRKQGVALFFSQLEHTSLRPTKVGQHQRQCSPIGRQIWSTLEIHGVVGAVGEASFFAETNDALAAAEAELLNCHGAKGERLLQQLMASSLLFLGLTRSAVIALGQQCQKRRYPAGEVIFNQGEAGRSAIFLARGEMEVMLDIPGSRRRKRIAILTPGSLIGELGLLDGDARSATVLATQPSICFELEEGEFRQLQQQQPELCNQLLHNLCLIFASRLRYANTMIAELER
ncbi:MAG: SLC26A/SulP transporter family protein [Gammaproteobacteria bacterium]|nr:SLC26A/SulP transporter family protein [Gammaproteobacteria bacterium]